MRLTLRTLLAWLDDTLPPADVREIGRQVTESTVAQELKERIARVTRQRRLTVPPSSGPEAVDPNLVAGYIDNELTPEQVTEYEKRCLTSDVHLAEVASVHQILSGIGQKAKVPDEARTRMYQLIKGRESVGADVPRTFAPPKPSRPDEPLEPWASQELPGRAWLEQFGPVAAVLGLIFLLGWLLWANLTETRPPVVALTGPVNVAPGGAGQGPQASDLDEAAAKKEAEPVANPDSEDQAAMDAAAAQAKEAEERAAAAPPGAVALTGPSAGVLLRYNPATRDWERLAPQTPVKDGDSLVSLAPFHNPLQFGPAQIILVGETAVRARTAEAEEAARLDLNRGRLVVQGAEQSIAVGIANQTLKITPPAGVLLGLQRVERRRPGERALPAVLQIIVPEGDAVVASAAGSQTLTGPSVLEFNPATAQFTEPESQAAPAWVTDSGPSPQEIQAGEPFARYFKPGQSPFSNLVEASEDPTKEVSGLAIAALGATGNYDLVIPLLSAPDRPAARRAALATLRSAIAQGPDSLTEIRNLLDQTWGADTGLLVEKLLKGYSTEEAKDNATYVTLVAELVSKDPGLRELAIDNLQTLTGRDRMQYNPDSPEGPGLQAWQDLLKNKLRSPEEAPQPKSP